MKRLAYTGVWFIIISIIVSWLFRGQSLGYFWVVVGCLSVFFGYHSEKKLEIPENASRQLEVWIKKYQNLSYYQRHFFLNDLVKRAALTNQCKEVEEFLKYLVNADPDNEMAKGMLFSIWGSTLAQEERRI
ncbi:MAG: hypothetical protein ACOWWO_03140 [Peptococcaceae bacterium]